MRNFFEYVEKGKEQIVGEDSVDVLFEGFREDLMRTENIDSIKSFIIGFLAGSGIDLRKNKTNIETLLKKGEFQNMGEVLKQMTIPDGKDMSSIKKLLGKSLNQLRPILKSEDKSEDKME